MPKTTTLSGLQSIGAVERDTGIGKDTLRVWERRYGFPVPQRDARGERVYTPEQVRKLRLLKRLIDRGHRPGKIVGQDIAQLQALMPAAVPARDEVPALGGELAACLEQCRLHRAEELRRTLTQALLRTGLHGFVLDIVAPLTAAVGDCWEHGRFEVYEEHLYTEVVGNVLRGAISATAAARDQDGARPRILLTTFPQEQHALGLLMAEAMFALEGAACVSLGVQTPIADIARAAQHCDVVALSFSTAMNANQVVQGLGELAAVLPPAVEIWAGGASPALARCTLPALRRVDLVTAARQIADWRRMRAV